eukprot:TRINITY_DN2819_c0_g1_i4.p1 TRINITY_DN2819_c0_g1~~TRINITY_DN2819_c0_g1_i4.p1  ORF type:complete len:792 (-),score=149.55 TRINITY_DN2819_c0_g1_i4:69-2444(-)
MGENSPVLFDYVLVVSVTGKGPANVTYRFPPASEDRKDTISKSIVQFCFPEEGEIKHSSQNQCETFSFVLTEGDGSKRFGYCRRFAISNNASECYCIISWIPSFNLFSQMLDIVEERRQHSSSAVFVFLKSVLANPFPAPGESISVTTLSATGNVPDKYELTRPSGNDFLLDYVTFEKLLSSLSTVNIVHLFASLMLERRVIISSNNLTDLSSVVNALVAALNPFTWQHVFIPVLPKSLLDYCSAPMPFFVGILSSALPLLDKIPMEEVLIVDLQKGAFLRNPDEDGIVMPASLFSALVRGINSVKEQGLKGRALDLQIARVFLSFHIKLFGGYSKFLTNHKFDVNAFIQAQPKDNQKFLRRMQEAQLWEGFVREREIMSRKGTLNTCIFVQEGKHSQVELTSQELFCWKCAETIVSDFVIKRGVTYCKSCSSSNSYFSSLLHGADDRAHEKIKKKLESIKSKMETLKNKIKPQKEGDDESEEKEKKPSSKPGSFIASEEAAASPRRHGTGDKKTLATTFTAFFSSDKSEKCDKSDKHDKSAEPKPPVPSNSCPQMQPSSNPLVSSAPAPPQRFRTVTSPERAAVPALDLKRTDDDKKDVRDRREDTSKPLVRSLSVGRLTSKTAQSPRGAEKTPLYSARGEKTPARAATTPTPQAVPPKLSFKEKMSNNFTNLKDKLMTDRSEKQEPTSRDKPKDKDFSIAAPKEGSRLASKPKQSKPELSRVKSAVDVSPKIKPAHSESEKKGSAIFSLGDTFGDTKDKLFGSKVGSGSTSPKPTKGIVAKNSKIFSKK